jgi:hypothetical protein
MLVWGTANPEGLGDSYNGLFFRAADIQQSVDEIVGKPVKIEHKGADVGRVVSAWTDRSGKLDLLLEINTRDVEVPCLFAFFFARPTLTICVRGH